LILPLALRELQKYNKTKLIVYSAFHHRIGDPISEVPLATCTSQTQTVVPHSAKAPRRRHPPPGSFRKLIVSGHTSLSRSSSINRNDIDSFRSEYLTLLAPGLSQTWFEHLESNRNPILISQLWTLQIDIQLYSNGRRTTRLTGSTCPFLQDRQAGQCHRIVQYIQYDTDRLRSASSRSKMSPLILESIRTNSARPLMLLSPSSVRPVHLIQVRGGLLRSAADQ
jgi:hypothetical protein